MSSIIKRTAATMLSCFACGSHSVLHERQTAPFMPYAPSCQAEQLNCPALYSLQLTDEVHQISSLPEEVEAGDVVVQSYVIPDRSLEGFPAKNGSFIKEAGYRADTSLSSSLQDEELKLVIASATMETEEVGEIGCSAKEQVSNSFISDTRDAPEEQRKLVKSVAERSEGMIGESSVPRKLPDPTTFDDVLKTVHQRYVLEEDIAVHKRICNETDEGDKGSYTEPEQTLDGDNEVYHELENVSSIHGNKFSIGSLFSYQLSEIQRDWAFLSAGLVIQAVGFQLTSMVEVVATILLLLNEACLFLSHSVQKVALVQKIVFQKPHFARYWKSFEETWGYLKPWLKANVKKAGWRCLKVACLLAMLCALMITSFLLSYFVLKRSSSMQQKPIHIKKELYFDYTKSHPVALLDLNALSHQSKYPRACLTSVPASVNHFHCTIFLTLPESDHNRQLGVFQVASELVSGNTGNILMRASQPCMLRFRSYMLQHVKSIFMLVPLLAGAASEAQTLGLELPQWATRQWEISSNVSLRVMLMPRAGRPISVGLPELYKAEVHLELCSWRMPGAHTLRTTGKNTATNLVSFISVGITLFVILFGCLLIIYICMMRHSKFK